MWDSDLTPAASLMIRIEGASTPLTAWFAMEACEHLISPAHILCRREMIYTAFSGRRI
jgi:hypothetical protein